MQGAILCTLFRISCTHVHTYARVMCVHALVCVCVCVWLHVCECGSVCVSVWMTVYGCVSLYAFVHIYVCLDMCTRCMWECVCVWCVCACQKGI